MRIVVDINHPAHVHYFKNFIWEMRKRGHDILITASCKDLSYKLLDDYAFSYKKLGSYGPSVYSKAVNIPVLDMKMYKAVKDFNPDLFLGFGSIRASHVSKIMRKPCIAFDDSEPSPIEHMLYVPYTDTIVTPYCFKKDFGKKHIRYDGYIELAYLHPGYFIPNPAALEDIGLNKNDKFVVIRFVAWNAGHDIRHSGFDIESKIRLVKELNKYASVFITSESKLPGELEKYRLVVSPIKIHDILHYAHLFVGDSQTMTTESGIIGTPAIRCNSFVGENDMGNFIELENKYGLIFNYGHPGKAIDKAIDIINTRGLKSQWFEKRKKLLSDKINITQFMVWLIENYPKSCLEIKNNPGIQYSFT